MISIALSLMASIFFAASDATREAQVSDTNDRDEKCTTLELVEGYDTYNGLVCEGIRLMGQGLNADAAERFEKALEIQLFEQPNFQLLPRLALARSRAGDRLRAKAASETAEIALQILTGVARCVETDEWFELVTVYGERIRSPHHHAVVRRMCGAARDGCYLHQSLEAFLHDADLAHYFFEVKSEIESDQRLP